MPRAGAALRSALAPGPSLAAVALVLGFLAVTLADGVARSRRAEEPRRAELVGLIESRREQVGSLDREVEALRAEVREARERASRLGDADRRRADALATLSIQAGATPVQGPALVVRMRDSERVPAEPEDATAYRIHDTDLQLVVNALFAAGAEAVAVNDSRVVATTPIRAAGDTIVVNFRPLLPPYEVVAVGAGKGAFERSEIARRFEQWQRLFGLGWSVRAVPRGTVPGFTGRLSPAHAVPVPEP